MGRSFANTNLGQHFLIDTLIREHIINCLPLGGLEHGFEIGPGLGFLTSELIKKFDHVKAVDIDPRNVERLKKQFSGSPYLEVIEGDFLKFDLSGAFPEGDYALVGNIPYYITTPILRKIFLETEHTPSFLILMVQKEVAYKLAQDPFHPKKPRHNFLSLVMTNLAEVSLAFEVPRSAFSPAPNVDSAVITARFRPTPLIKKSNHDLWIRILKMAFLEPRKKLANSLHFSGVDWNIERRSSIDKRPEALSFEEWNDLLDFLKSQKI